MIGYSDLVSAFRNLNLPLDSPVMVHASLSAFGQVEGGAQTVVEALIEVFHTVLMPAFTYKTMVVPNIGPPDNGLAYGTYSDANRQAQFFRPEMPVDRLIGIIPEVFRLHPGTLRSHHPILSLVGINADRFIESQTIAEPLAPFRLLFNEQAWVLLLGVDHTVNTALHYAEKLAGRRQFVRWALTLHGVVECPGFPGCSDGFDAIMPHLVNIVRKEWAGQALIQAIPMVDLITIARAWLEDDSMALLCNRSFCERCRSFQSDVETLAQNIGDTRRLF
jgi:aminoglycoside 3-N-acetyltransferase